MEARVLRLELRYVGKQQEKILEAKTEALDIDKIQSAMAERADYEADRLADQIIGNAYPQLPRQNQVGYVHAQSYNDPKDRRR